MLTFLYFIFLFYGVEHQNYDLKLTAYFILAVASFIALLNTILNFYQTPDHYTPFKDMVRKTLLEFFKRLNKKYLEAGLSFDVNDNHFYIEIKIKEEVARKYRQQIQWELSKDMEWDEEEDDYKENYYEKYCIVEDEEEEDDDSLYTGPNNAAPKN